MEKKVNNWELQIKDEMIIIKKLYGLDETIINNNSLAKLAKKYLGCNCIENILIDDIGKNSIKIKIKARKGKIVIEKIDK